MKLSSSIDHSGTGDRYGSRTQIGPSFLLPTSDHRVRHAVFGCACGRVSVVRLSLLRQGRSHTCRQCMEQTLVDSKTKHGMCEAPEYKVWRGMIGRCTHQSHPAYDRYGGRGIDVCKAWRESFAEFYKDVGSRPGPRYELDRIDNDGHYEPGNVQWLRQDEHGRKHRRKSPERVTDLVCAHWS